MQYAPSYLDNLFYSIADYHSQIELFNIAYQNTKNKPCDWILELCEILNWQAMSDRSGVWTYYESLCDESAQILIKSLEDNNEHDIFEQYSKGIRKFIDTILMDEIDLWIKVNEQKINQYVENILITNKSWFYQI